MCLDPHDRYFIGLLDLCTVPGSLSPLGIVYKNHSAVAWKIGSRDKTTKDESPVPSPQNVCFVISAENFIPASEINDLSAYVPLCTGQLWFGSILHRLD